MPSTRAAFLRTLCRGSFSSFLTVGNAFVLVGYLLNFISASATLVSSGEASSAMTWSSVLPAPKTETDVVSSANRSAPRRLRSHILLISFSAMLFQAERVGPPEGEVVIFLTGTAKRRSLHLQNHIQILVAESRWVLGRAESVCGSPHLLSGILETIGEQAADAIAPCVEQVMGEQTAFDFIRADGDLSLGRGGQNHAPSAFAHVLNQAGSNFQVGSGRLFQNFLPHWSSVARLQNHDLGLCFDGFKLPRQVIEREAGCKELVGVGVIEQQVFGVHALAVGSEFRSAVGREVDEDSILRHGLSPQPINLLQEVFSSRLLVEQDVNVVTGQIPAFELLEPLPYAPPIRFRKRQWRHQVAFVLPNPNDQSPGLPTPFGLPEKLFRLCGPLG